MENFDLVVIGGGVIGCAALRACVEQHPGLSACLIEREKELAVHQSGRNSGVVHVGYNQKPGSMKAKFVVEGNRRLREYCLKKEVPLKMDGILIVARQEEELDTLFELQSRASENGATVEIIDAARIIELEPAAHGKWALFAPEGASFDSRSFVYTLAQDAIDRGAQFLLSEEVVSIKEEAERLKIATTHKTIHAKLLIVAAGLYADDLAHIMGLGKEYHVFPFRGDYYELVSGGHLVKSHIYAAPDLKFPFLGVHLSRNFDDTIRVGPGAILALGKKAYSRTSVQPLELARMATRSALWKLFASSNMRDAMKREWKKSLFPSEVLKEARQLVPDLPDDCLAQAPSGIRAQVVSSRGDLVDDLTILETRRSIHVLNAVSPALTCSLPFADYIADLVQKKIASL